MKNIKITLDCISGILTIYVKNQEFQNKIKLNSDSWTAISVGKKSKKYDLKFVWNNTEMSKPKVHIHKIENQFGFGLIPIETRIAAPMKTVEVEIVNGCKEDFHGKYFPDGYQSWISTFYLIGREIDGIKGYDELVSKLGSTMFFTETAIWTDEFETRYKGAEWDGDFEDTVMDFLKDKINSELDKLNK